MKNTIIIFSLLHAFEFIYSNTAGDDLSNGLLNQHFFASDVESWIRYQDEVDWDDHTDLLSMRGFTINQSFVKMGGMRFQEIRNNSPFFNLPLCAVSRVKVTNDWADASYGNFKSGLIDIVPKGGSRDHYEFNLMSVYSAPAPKYFGPSIYNPNSYFLRPYLDDAVCWDGPESGGWDEATRYSYPYFVGWNAMSESTILDSDPDNDMTAKQMQRLFKWQHRRHEITNKPDYVIDAGFGGPVPGFKKSLQFYSAYKTKQSMLAIPLTFDDFKEKAWYGRVDGQLNSRIRFNLQCIINNVKLIYPNDMTMDPLRTPYQAIYHFESTGRIIWNTRIMNGIWLIVQS